MGIVLVGLTATCGKVTEDARPYSASAIGPQDATINPKADRELPKIPGCGSVSDPTRHRHKS
jgi:hypothetical protein